jgi:protein involved in polysaccharide export with SLBB domain
MRFAAVVVSMCVAVLGGRAFGQQAGGGAAAVKPDSNPARATIEESLGTIEKRDLLRVRIEGLKPPPGVAEKWVRVDEEGAASLPFLGPRKLAGMTTTQAEADLAKAYLEAKVIQHAQIDLRRIEAGSRVKDANAGKLTKGDLVAVTVDDLTGPGVTSEFRSHVGAEGEVAMPMLGGVKLDGMTEGQAEKAIAKAYLDRSLIQNAVVGVRVVEPAAQAKVKPGPIGKGDLLSLAVYDLAGPGVRSEFQARVGTDGQVGFPYVGGVPVDGLSEAKSAEAIAKALREKGISAGAVVAVYRAQSADAADVKLGPVAAGEVLRITLTELAGPGVESTKTVKVDPQGNIAMPFVGAVKVAGLTEAAVAKAVATAFRDRNLVANMSVAALKINGAAPLPDEELQPLASPTPSAQAARQARMKRR